MIAHWSRVCPRDGVRCPMVPSALESPARVLPTLDQPWWLLLLIVLPAIWWSAWRQLVTLSAARRAIAAAARSALVGLMALALAGPATVSENNRLAVVAVVDVSESVRQLATLRDERGLPLAIDGATSRFLARSSATRGPDDLLGIVSFDGRPGVIAAPSGASVVDRAVRPTGRPGTDLASAIEAAAALLPPDALGRLLVISDGVETTGSALDAARAIAASRGRRVPIDVAPIVYRADGEVILESLDAPPRAAAGSTVTLRATLRSTGPISGRLRVTADGLPLDLNGGAPGDGLPVTLEAGTSVRLVDVPLGGGRLHRFDVVFEPDTDAGGRPVGDRSASNNAASAFTTSPGSGEVLVIDGVSSGEPGAGAVLPGAVRAQGFPVDVVAPEASPAELLGLERYDLVVMHNVAADRMGEPARAALIDYVTELGGGLVVVGGPEALGPGAWLGTPLADILPVHLDLPDAVVAPGMAVIFVIDNSGSMGAEVFGSGRTQQQIANEAAALAIASLDRRDLVGVITFNSRTDEPIRVAPNADARAAGDRVRRISPGGGTDALPAMRLALQRLADVEADVKHVVLLSDGQSQNAEELPGLARQMHAAGIRVTTIGIGIEADTKTLNEIAVQGAGGDATRASSTLVQEPELLPQVLLRAVRVVRRPLIREERFSPLITDAGSPTTRGLDALPDLAGLVLTRAREAPGVVQAMVTPRGEPVLAHWNVGLGQVAVFTSDAARWAQDWQRWEGFGPFWASVARVIGRRVGDDAGEVLVQHTDTGVRVRYDARDPQGRPTTDLDATATVFDVDGQREPVRLVPTSPGRYEALVPALEGRSAGRPVAVLVRPTRGGTPMPPVFGAVGSTPDPELRVLESRERELRRLAEVTGGREFDFAGQGPTADVLFDRSGVSPARSTQPLWPVLLPWAMVAFVLDVAARRVAWDRLIESPVVTGAVAAGARASGATLAAARRLVRRREPLSGVPDADPSGPSSDDPRGPGPWTKSSIAPSSGPAAEPAADPRPEPVGPMPQADAQPARDEASDAGNSGLFAAKRRAREQIDRG